ncbi:MAG TPA: DUF2461 family protein [Candidatus Acidoferrum sp.]|nr:DUF2461 family protein [Candidatus Acidoferrum sp.]
MTAAKPVFSKETFSFLQDLKRNNKKVWMEANRERYQAALVRPFRKLLEATSQPILQIDERFDVCGRKNFSRINRDIRFAKDKTPYRAQMYLKFSVRGRDERETGELYIGLSAETVTVGFRIYTGAKRKDSALAMVAEPRVANNPQWVAGQKRRLGKKYESYWYAMEKGEWRKREGWPTGAEDWKRIRGWIVRRKMKPSAAVRPDFPREVGKALQEVYPLLKFTSLGE